MFDDVVVLTAAEYDAYIIAVYETEFGEDYPDAAGFVTDEHQRFLDARARLLCTGAAQLEAAVRADRQASAAAASRARALAGFARSRPAAMFDRVPGERGAASAASVAARPGVLTEVSEWAVDEASATLRVPGRTASLLLVDAITLVEGLPATLAALAAGDISAAHARVMTEIAGPVSTPGKRAEVEAAVLPRAAQQTVAALRACVRRAVTRIDAAAAAERLAAAVRDRQIRLDTRDDGMSALTILLTTPVGRACYEALSAYARACEFDEEGNRDPRTHQQRMTDCLADLILRPHADHPAVQVVLTLVAGVDTLTGQGAAAEEPGEVDGDLVPAALVRELAYTLGLLPRTQPAPAMDDGTVDDGTVDDGTVDDGTVDDGTVDDGTVDDGTVDDGTVDDGATAQQSASAQPAPRRDDGEPHADIDELRAGELAAAKELLDAVAAGHAGETSGPETRAALTRLLNARRLTGTALAQRPRIAVADQLSGALLALTDSTELRAAAASGHGLGPPCGTDAYRPTDPLYRFVTLRDRRCRFPGCRVRARCCDLDHQTPHPDGPTAHDNLACLCEHHHRLSHQAPGWQLHRDPDGDLVWTLPGGHTVTTHPPAYGTDDGSTPTAAPPRTDRQKYADVLARIRSSRATAPGDAAPF